MKTDEKNILALCQRMMDGMTSEEEETFLAEYFTAHKEVPESLKDYRRMFCLFAERNLDFTEAETERFSQETPHAFRFKRILKPLAVAASLALVCAVGWWQYGRMENQNLASTGRETISKVMTDSLPGVTAMPSGIVRETVRRVADAVKPRQMENSTESPTGTEIQSAIRWTLDATTDDAAAAHLLAASDTKARETVRARRIKEPGLRPEELKMTDKQIANNILCEILMEIRSNQQHLSKESEDACNTARQTFNACCVN